MFPVWVSISQASAETSDDDTQFMVITSTILRYATHRANVEHEVVASVALHHHLNTVFAQVSVNSRQSLPSHFTVARMGLFGFG